MLLSGDDTLLDWLGSHGGHAAVTDSGSRPPRSAEPGPRALEPGDHAQPPGGVDEVVRAGWRPGRCGRRGTLLDGVGYLAMHPVWGMPVLLVVLCAMYQFVGVSAPGRR